MAERVKEQEFEEGFLHGWITRDATIKEFEYLHNAIRNGTQPHKIQRGRGNN